MYRHQIILRLKAVEREFTAASTSVTDLLRRAMLDPEVIRTTGVSLADLRACRDNLERTYLVRLFAVFEEALREVRRILYRKEGAIQTYSLIQQCASRQRIPSDEIRSVHDVRELRNAIIHGGDSVPLSLPTARQGLCIFMSRMPPQW
jgi:hypothetical protein